MTKTEQLAEKYADAKAACYDDYYDIHCNIKDAYRNGAYDMLERVCEWMKTYADDFGVPESESGKVYVNDLVAELRKDMEE